MGRWFVFFFRSFIQIYPLHYNINNDNKNSKKQISSRYYYEGGCVLYD